MNIAEMGDQIARMPLGVHRLKKGKGDRVVRGFNVPAATNSNGEVISPMRITADNTLEDGSSEKTWYTVVPTGRRGGRSVMRNSAVYPPYLTISDDVTRLNRMEPLSTGETELVGVRPRYIPDNLAPGSVALVFRPVTPRPVVVFDASAQQVETAPIEPVSSPTVVFDSARSLRRGDSRMLVGNIG